MAEVFFWCASLALVHTYFLYPLILFALEGVAQVVQSRRKPRGGRPPWQGARPGRRRR